MTFVSGSGTQHGQSDSHLQSFRSTVLEALSRGFRKFSFQVQTNNIHNHRESCRQNSADIHFEASNERPPESQNTFKTTETDNVFSSNVICDCCSELDDFKIKVEAWQTACSTALMLLNTDMEIVTSHTGTDSCQGLEKYVNSDCDYL